MKIKKSTLLEALNKVYPTIEKSPDAWSQSDASFIEGGDSFIFDKTHVRTYSNSMSISFPLDTGFVCGVKAQELLKLLSKMKGDEIEIDLVKDELMVRDKKTVSMWKTVKYAAIMGHLENLNLAAVSWKRISKDFLDALNACRFSASTNAGMGVMCGVYCGDNDVMTTDNYRASWYMLDAPIKHEFVLSTEVVRELIALDSITKYSFNDPWIHFSNATGVIFSVRSFAGKYPKKGIKELFADTSGKKYTLPDNFRETVERVSVLSFKDKDEKAIDDFVELYTKNDKLVCRGERAFGRVEERLDANRNVFPKNIKLRMSCKYLLDMIDRYDRSFILRDDGAVLFSTDKMKHLFNTLRCDDKDVEK